MMKIQTESAALSSLNGELIERVNMIAVQPAPPSPGPCPACPGPSPALAGATAEKSGEVVAAKEPHLYLRALFASTDHGRHLMLKQAAGKKAPVRKPSQEEIDSYDMKVVTAIRNADIPLLRTMVKEGKSLNACNRFGESLIHMACRRGDLTLVNFLVNEVRVRVDVRDDYGRTPLHDACWTPAPNFAVMDVLVRAVPPELMLTEDVRGHSPFQYARQEHWHVWVQFLQERQKLLLTRLSTASTT
jgi:hypothetical protein